MPITTRQLRRQLRQSVGLSLGLLDQSEGQATVKVTGGASADGWTSSALTLESSASSNEQRGKWAVGVAGNSSNVGTIRRVSASTSSNGRVGFLTPWPGAPDTTMTFELWHESVPPTLVNDFINQTITEAMKKGAVPIRDLNLHTFGIQRTYPFAAGSSFIGIQEIEYRATWAGEKVTTLDTVMSSGADATVVTDSEDYREGAASNKITIGAAVSSAAVVATDSFTAINLAGYTHLEFWAKSNVTTTASALQVRLGEGSTNRETLAIPAMTQDQWTYHRVALSSAETDSAISRFIVMTGASDAGAMVVWVDDAKAVRDGSESWTRVNPKFWGLDQAQRSLVLEQDADVPYALLRVTGRRAPNLLSTDTAVCDIEADYVINSVAAKVLRARVGVNGSNRGTAAQQADLYEQLARRQYLNMRTPATVRWLESS